MDTSCKLKDYVNRFLLEADDYEECPIIEIDTRDGDRFIHYHGYFYCSASDDGPKPWRFVTFCGAIEHFDEVVQNGVVSFLIEHEEYYKQYISDHSANDALRIINEFDSVSIDETRIDSSIKDGRYIVFPASRRL